MAALGDALCDPPHGEGECGGCEGEEDRGLGPLQRPEAACWLIDEGLEDVVVGEAVDIEAAVCVEAAGDGGAGYGMAVGVSEAVADLPGVEDSAGALWEGQARAHGRDEVLANDSEDQPDDEVGAEAGGGGEAAAACDGADRQRGGRREQRVGDRDDAFEVEAAGVDAPKERVER